MTIRLAAKTPPWRNEVNPLGPPANPAISSPINAAALQDLEGRINSALAEIPDLGAVESVNGQTGAVNLTAGDVGADPAGAASTAVAMETTRAEAAEALLAPKASPTFTGAPKAPTAAAGTNTPQLATTAFVAAGLPFIDPRQYGAKGDGATDDTAALQAAINAAGPAPIWLGNRQYVISSPLVMKTGSKLIGPTPQLYYPPSVEVATQLLYPLITASAGFSGTGMIQVRDAAITGESNQPQGVVLQGFSLYGANVANCGVYFEGGGVIDAVVQDVTVFNTTAYGFWVRGGASRAVQNVTLRGCTGYAIGVASSLGGHSFYLNGASTAGCYDNVLDRCWSVACNGTGFYVDTRCASIYFRDCRAEHSAFNANAGGGGYLIQSADKITLDGCKTDQNQTDGIASTSALAPGSQGVVLSSCVTRRDGAGGTGYAAVRIVDAGPVQITGHNNDVSNGDNGQGKWGPDYGVYTSANSLVSVTGGWFKSLFGVMAGDGTATVFTANVVRQNTPSTTLSAAVMATAATIPVASTSGFAASGSIQIGTEVIAYTGVTATSFTGCTRGAASTAAAAHASGAAVFGPTSPATLTNA